MPFVLGDSDWGQTHHQSSSCFWWHAGLTDERDLSIVTRLGCGAVAGTTGQTVAYPLDVVRRRLQVQLHTLSNSCILLPDVTQMASPHSMAADRILVSWTPVHTYIGACCLDLLEHLAFPSFAAPLSEWRILHAMAHNNRLQPKHVICCLICEGLDTHDPLSKE